MEAVKVCTAAFYVVKGSWKSIARLYLSIQAGREMEAKNRDVVKLPRVFSMEINTASVSNVIDDLLQKQIGISFQKC